MAEDPRKAPLALAALTECPGCRAGRIRLQFAGTAFCIATFSCAAEVLGSDCNPRLIALAGCRNVLARALAAPPMPALPEAAHA